MTRGGRNKERGEPERRCLVTGQTSPKVGLVRFAVGPGDVVTPDILERLPGRGLWVTSDATSIGKAVSQKAFARGARQQVVVEGDLLAATETAIARRVIELISLARKAGRAVAGYEKVKSWLANGEARVLLQASDGSGRGKTKLRPPGGPETHIEVLTGSELGLAFGRENVIHGALATGGLTTRVVEEASRLSGLRATDGGDRPTGKGTTTR